MILRPVLPGITDHGSLNGLADDDHADYLRINTNRGVSGNKIYVGPNCYLEETAGVLNLVVTGSLRVIVNGVEEQRW